MKSVLDRVVGWMGRNLVIATVLVYVVCAFVVSGVVRLIRNLNL